MMATATIERAMTEGNRLLDHGVFVAVVGPSGAGKDTIIGYARERLQGRSEFFFVRRVVTRASKPAAEDHDMMDDTAFEDAVRQGGFAVHWRAHGLSYGLPRQIDEEIERGVVVIANVSRGVVENLKAAYKHLAVVQITAEATVLGKRLAARGRETPEEVEKRLRREAVRSEAMATAIRIDNSGPLAQAGDRFLAILERAAAFAAVSQQI